VAHVHVPPQTGGSLLRVGAKPLKALGAGPPERLFKLDHCEPHHVRVTGVGAASAVLTLTLPRTKAPEGR
jgi:hypothetical protein